MSGLDGERGRNRTFNLLIKSQLLCQLSYAPFVGGKRKRKTLTADSFKCNTGIRGSPARRAYVRTALFAATPSSMMCRRNCLWGWGMLCETGPFKLIHRLLKGATDANRIIGILLLRNCSDPRLKSGYRIGGNRFDFDRRQHAGAC